MNYCPNCIEPLKRESKKLGSLSRWLVCPKCGYRVREASILFDEKHKMERFEKEKERINNKWIEEDE